MVGMHEFNLLPAWLLDVAEHELVAVDLDPGTLAGYSLLHADVHLRSYWIKVSSSHSLEHAIAAASADVQRDLRRTPLYVFLTPSIPLADAQHVLTVMTGETELVLEKVDSSSSADVYVLDVNKLVLCYHALVDRGCKVALFHAAERALEGIRQARELVAEALANRNHQRGFTDGLGLSAAEPQEASTPEQLAAATPEQLADVDELFVPREARWRVLAARLTLLGYSPSSSDGHGVGTN